MQICIKGTPNTTQKEKSADGHALCLLMMWRARLDSDTTHTHTHKFTYSRTDIESYRIFGSFAFGYKLSIGSRALVKSFSRDSSIFKDCFGKPTKGILL